MPMYDFMCTACDARFEDVQLTIANRDVPTTEPCPLCDAPQSIERCVSSPHVGDAIRVGRSTLPSGWTDRLQQIKSTHHRSTMHVPTPRHRQV